VYWNTFFISANLFQIIRLLLERREVKLSEELQTLFDTLFYPALTAPEFRRLVNTGTQCIFTHMT
jgi:hypothetical protein